MKTYLIAVIDAVLFISRLPVVGIVGAVLRDLAGWRVAPADVRRPSTTNIGRYHITEVVVDRILRIRIIWLVL